MIQNKLIKNFKKEILKILTNLYKVFLKKNVNIFRIFFLLEFKFSN